MNSSENLLGRMFPFVGAPAERIPPGRRTTRSSRSTSPCVGDGNASKRTPPSPCTKTPIAARFRGPSTWRLAAYIALARVGPGDLLVSQGRCEVYPELFDILDSDAQPKE